MFHYYGCGRVQVALIGRIRDSDGSSAELLRESSLARALASLCDAVACDRTQTELINGWIDVNVAEPCRTNNSY